MQRDFELKAYTFDAELHEAAAEGGKIELPEKPEGQQTAIGAALEDVLRREAGKRLLGVVLLSDGAQRAYAPRDLPPQTAAARLKHLGYPVFTFPLGQSRGLGEAKDVAVKDLIANPNVFVKNELTVSGQVRVDGYVNVDIPVRLLFETAPGKMEAVAQQTIHATADGQLLPVSFSYIPQTPGECRLTLEAAEQPGELVTTNNRLSTFVQVLKGGLNVLYLEGALRVEQKFIRRALDSSPDIKVDYVRIDPRDPKTRPPDMADRFKPGKYDVYILGDIDSTAFSGDELAELAKCVSRGAGLIDARRLSELWGRRLRRNAPGQGAAGGHGPAGTAAARRAAAHRSALAGAACDAAHAAGIDALRLVAGRQPRRRTRRCGRSCRRWKGPTSSTTWPPGPSCWRPPGWTSRCWSPTTTATAACSAFAGDSTWRWWMHGYESAFKRFWRQIVLWLAQRTRRRRATFGSGWPSAASRLRSGWSSPWGPTRPRASRSPTPQYKAEVVLPDGARRPLPLVRQAEQMAGSFRDTQTAGDYAVEVSATQKDQPLGSARARFLVFQQDLELDNASADAPTMESLAAMTGGQSLAPEQLPGLIKRLAEDTQHLDVQQETKSTFWDTWPFFLTIVCLLGVEWYLRKRWGLV